MKIRVDVMPKEGVLDPQGTAIGRALQTLGFKGVGEVRAGKIIEFEVAEKDPGKAGEIARKMAEELLANLVIEDYRINVL
jgi:phosphoribosylformylglycinamidine synthase